MGKDDRIWGKFAVDFPDNPKILPLSDAAFRCFVEATLYSRRMLSDGFLASRLAVAKWGLEPLQELCSNDPEKPSLIEVEGGYMLRDFASHQDTKADVEARRERAKSAGSLGGKARAKQVAKQTGSKSLSKTQAETETETETERTSPKGDVARKRASRIPDSFIVTTEMRSWAASETPGIDVDGSTRKFVDYWRAKSGRDATKLDWIATWRNWLRNDRERAAPAGGVTKPKQRIGGPNGLSAEEFHRQQDERAEAMLRASNA